MTVSRLVDAISGEDRATLPVGVAKPLHSSDPLLEPPPILGATVPEAAVDAEVVRRKGHWVGGPLFAQYTVAIPAACYMATSTLPASIARLRVVAQRSISSSMILMVWAQRPHFAPQPSEA